MTIIAAAIITRNGKPLVSRQFQPIPQSRISALLLSFPRLLPSSSTTSQHTMLSTSTTRYVYQPLDNDLYLVLLTPLSSNIVQDNDTLKLFVRVTIDLLRAGGGQTDEKEVLARSFDLLTAYDEIVSLGWRENVSLSGIRSIIEMESHEEKIQEIIARNKEQEAKEELKRRAKQLEHQRREMLKRGQSPFVTPGAPSMLQHGSGGISSSGNSGYGQSPAPYDRPQQREEERYSALKPARPFKSKGMQLGGGGGAAAGKKAGLLAAALGGEDEDEDEEVPTPAAYQQHQQQHQQYEAPQQQQVVQAQQAQQFESPFPAVHQESVHLLLREKLTLSLSHEGSLSTLELSGSLDLRITDASVARLLIAISPDSGLQNFGPQELQFKTHPNVDKKKWGDERKIGLKDPKRSFPVSQGLGVLKWRLNTKDETAVPLSVSCWPSPGDDGNCIVNIEYELQNENIELTNTVITIPLPPNAYPTLTPVEYGTLTLSTTTHSLIWTIPTISPGEDSANGSAEFTVPTEDTEAFFPIEVNFFSDKSMVGVEVVEVVDPSGEGGEVTWSGETLLSTEEYVIT